MTLAALVVSGSIAASRARLLPRWVIGVGLAAGAISLLSTAALLWTPASVLLPLGRLLSSIWIIRVSIALIRGEQRTGADIRNGVMV